MDDMFNSPLSNLGALCSNPIMDILEHQERIHNLTASPLMDSVLEHQEQMEHILSSPAIQAIQAQHDLVENQLSTFRVISASAQIPNIASFPSQSAIDAAVKSMQDFPAYDLAANMGKALEVCIPERNHIAKVLSSALENCLPQLDYIRETALRVGNYIPKVEHAVLSIADQALHALDGFTAFAQESITEMGNAFSGIDLSYFNDFSNRLSYVADFHEKNELLKTFGWYLISELPEEVIDEIYERRDEITQEEVDALIVGHFRRNRCQSLKDIVSSWTMLPYFVSRKDVFHEAQVSHSRRSFIASTMLISIHFEGVVTDFVRNRMIEPTYRVKKALECINDMANELTMGSISFQDWIVCSYALEFLDDAFATNFSPADPDSCPNTSRHKIAHGHATAKETEANSLRRFLFMNELYKLFCCLENEYHLAS